MVLFVYTLLATLGFASQVYLGTGLFHIPSPKWKLAVFGALTALLSMFLHKFEFQLWTSPLMFSFKLLLAIVLWKRDWFGSMLLTTVVTSFSVTIEFLLSKLVYGLVDSLANDITTASVAAWIGFGIGYWVRRKRWFFTFLSKSVYGNTFYERHRLVLWTYVLVCGFTCSIVSVFFYYGLDWIELIFHFIAVGLFLILLYSCQLEME